MAARLEDLHVDALLVTHQLHTRYLTGFTGSNGQVLLRPDDALFLTDGRYTEQSRREVPDLPRHTVENPLREELPGLLDGVARLGFEAEDLTVAARDRFAEALAEVELVSTTDVIEPLRAVKDDDERATIRTAQAITDRAFERILGTVEPVGGEQLGGALGVAHPRQREHLLVADRIALVARRHRRNGRVIGGEQIFRHALDIADEIVATEVHAHVDGDTFFPPMDQGTWQETERLPQPEENGYRFDFVVYKRQAAQ